MKKLFYLTPVAIIFSVIIANNALTFSSGPPAGMTGAPGDNDCTNCHGTFALNSGSATTSISGITDYVPSQTYAITVSLGPLQAANRNGFQLVVLEDAGDTDIGTITMTDPINTQIITANGRTYTGQTTAGSGLSSWSFDWTAPSSNVGSVTFYTALNDADDDNSADNDYIYTISLNVAPVVGINQTVNQIAGLQVYPNPASNYFVIQGNYELPAVLEMYNIIGERVRSEKISKHNAVIDVSHLTKGLYLWQLGTARGKLLKQ